MSVHLISNLARNRICSIKCVSDMLGSRTILSPKFHNYSRSAVFSSAVMDHKSKLLSHTPILRNIQEFSTTPKMLAASHDHATMWSAERGLSVGLLVLVPAAFMYPSQLLDTVLAITLVMHNHWGIEANVVDYIRPKIFGKFIPAVAHAALIVFSLLTLTGSFFIIFNDAGIANFVRMVWKL